MQRPFLLTIFILGLLAGFFVFAQKISYPVQELGNCQDRVECKAYCETVNHVMECLDFAKLHNLLTPAEIVETEKVAKVWKEGVAFPGNCQTKSECLTYCYGYAHIDECLDFAETAKLISPDELREARQVAKALAKGLKAPGNCWGRQRCDVYCRNPAHGKECIKFARAAGLISAEEADLAERVMPLIEKGESPGGCKTKEECEAYCADESHVEECVQFASKIGVVTAEELEMFRKTGGKRPGNCKSREECDAFCENPENQEVCLEFAKKYGLLSQEEIEKIEEGLRQREQGRQRIMNAVNTAPPEVLECLRERLGSELVENMKTGNFTSTPEMGETVKQCFESIMGPPQQPPSQ